MAEQSELDHLDRRWLSRAIDLSRLCPTTVTAYAVGAVIVDATGRELTTGYSREVTPVEHAEQVALDKLRHDDRSPAGATMYTSMEPCSSRRSHAVSCTELIIRAGISRVVLALREPPHFVSCIGVQLLHQAGIAVVEFPDLGGEVLAVNAAVLGVLP